MSKEQSKQGNYSDEVQKGGVALKPQDARNSHEIADVLGVGYMPNGTAARITRQEIAEQKRGGNPGDYDKRERKWLVNKKNHSTKVRRELLASEDEKIVRRYYQENKEGKYFVQIVVEPWSDSAEKLYSILLDNICQEWRNGNIGITEIVIPEFEFIKGNGGYELAEDHKSLKEMLEGPTGARMNSVEIGIEYTHGGFAIAPIFSGSREVRDGTVRFGVLNISDGDHARLQSLMTYYAIIPRSVRGMSSMAMRLCEYSFEEARMHAAQILATGELVFTFEEISRALGLPSPYDDGIDSKHAKRKCVDPVIDAVDEANLNFKNHERGELHFTAENCTGKSKEIFDTCKFHLKITGEWINYFSAKCRDLQAGKDSNIKRIKDAKKKREARAAKKAKAQTKQERDEASAMSEAALASGEARWDRSVADNGIDENCKL